MALNLNKVFLAGNITHDLELKLTQSGKKTVTFNMAVNTYTKANGGGNSADFFTVVAWEEKAEFICRYFKKGSPIFIEGSLKNESWTDKQGNKRVTTKIIALNAQFVVGKQDAESSPAAGSGNYVPDSYRSAGNTGQVSSFEAVDDSQLPF